MARKAAERICDVLHCTTCDPEGIGSGSKYVNQVALLIDAEFKELVEAVKRYSESGECATSVDAKKCVKDTHPAYSTDPAAAMTVLEKCAERLGNYSVQIIGSPKHGYSITGSGERMEQCFADTLPLAICLFARALFEKEK